MDQRPFSRPNLCRLPPDGDVKAITVLLAGTMDTHDRSTPCVVRSVAPGRIVLETRAHVEPDDAVRLNLSGGRHLWGEVERREDSLVSLRLLHLPRWIEDLYGSRFAA